MIFNALIIEAMSGNYTVLSRFLEKLKIKPFRIQELNEIDVILGSGQFISFALIDTMGFNDSIWDYCKILKQKDIPMLIISPNNSSNMLKTGYEYGAKGVFRKPVLMQELANCIRSLLPEEGKKTGD